MQLKIIASLPLSLFVFFAHGQQQEEYKIHIQSIDTTYSLLGKVIRRTDTSFNEYRDFVRYTVKHLLEQPTDIKYISNRKLLPKLKHTTCNDLMTTISDTLKTGEKCSVQVERKSFNPKEHNVVFDSIHQNMLIDGDSGWFSLPEYEIKHISIKLNDKQLLIPKGAYHNIYDFNVCNNKAFQKKIEAYTSLDGQFIYIYIYGGEAAGNYFAKLIFNKEKYLTRIVADYYPLSIHGSFDASFVGY